MHYLWRNYMMTAPEEATGPTPCTLRKVHTRVDTSIELFPLYSLRSPALIEVLIEV